MIALCVLSTDILQMATVSQTSTLPMQIAIRVITASSFYPDITTASSSKDLLQSFNLTSEKKREKGALLTSGAIEPVPHSLIDEDGIEEHISAWLSPTRFFIEGLAVGEHRCLRP